MSSKHDPLEKYGKPSCAGPLGPSDQYGKPWCVCPLGPSDHGPSMTTSHTKDSSNSWVLPHRCSHYKHTFHWSMEDPLWDKKNSRIVFLVNDGKSLSIYLTQLKCKILNKHCF